MNLIQAYKEAKVGDKIINDINFLYKDSGLHSLHDYISARKESFGLDVLFSDDWQIERKPLVWEGEVMWDHTEYSTPVFPYETFTSASGFDFKSLVGKRTKIRIEEIIEEEG